MSATSRSRRLFRVAVWLHRWTGLVAAPFFLVLCLSGSVLIFRAEIERAFGWDHAEVMSGGTGERHSYSELISMAMAKRPGFPPFSVYIADSDYDHPYIVLREKHGPEIGQVYRFNAFTGQEALVPREITTPTHFLLELHANWLLSRPGEFFGGLVAALVVLCLISGLWIYAPYVRRAPFGTIRRTKGEYVRQLDFHNLMGAVVLGWCLVVALTGLLMATSSLIDAVSGDEAPPQVTRSAGGAKLNYFALRVTPDAAQRAAEAALPGWSTGVISYPDGAKAERFYSVWMTGPKGVKSRLVRTVWVDADSGEVGLVSSTSVMNSALEMAEPLHFGDYGGLPLKILWCVLAWLTLYITGNGAWLWWRRRCRKRIPATTQVAGANL